MKRLFGFVLGAVLGIILGRVLHIGAPPILILAIIFGVIVSRGSANKPWRPGQVARGRTPKSVCPQCGEARVGRFCARCGTPSRN